MRKYKKKNNIMLLLILLIGISIGYSLLNTNLNIIGHSGINKNTWDIHWENVQPNVESNITAEEPTISNDGKTVSYELEFELPGDFYEFDVDAKNDGSISGIISDIKHTAYDVLEDEEITLPDYIKYSIVYKNTQEAPVKNDILNSKEKRTYTVRIEYDKNAKTLPNETKKIRITDEVIYTQTKDDDTKYKIIFNPNGGTVSETSRSIIRGTMLQELPIPTKENTVFKGWYTALTDGIKIDEETIPTDSVVYYAQWYEDLPIYDIGQNVNVKLKSLAGDELSDEDPYLTEDTNITSIVKSNIKPDLTQMTEANIISKSTSIAPIYAWFDNGVINIWSEAGSEYLAEDASYTFYNLKGLTSIDTSFKTSKTTNMSNLFGNNNALTSIDLSKFDTSLVTDFSSMFLNCSTLPSIDVSSFNTKNATTIASMFSGCGSITELDLSNFRTRNITDYKGFNALVSLDPNLKVLNLSNFDFTGFNISSLMMQIGSGYSNYDTLIMDNVIFPANCDFAIGGLNSLKNISLVNVDTSKVTNMSYMFQNTGANSEITELDVSSFDTSNVTNMSGMFYNQSALTELDLSNFDTSSVRNITAMFRQCKNLTKIDLSNFDTSRVESVYSLFGACSNLEEINLSNWDLTKVTRMDDITIYAMKEGNTSKLKKVIMDNAVFPSNMSYMFANLSEIEEVSIKNADTSRVTTMLCLFVNDNKLKKIDLSGIDTSNVINMSSMFVFCDSLTELVLNFDVGKVEDMGSMFYCQNLETIDIRTWNTKNLTNARGMFSNAPKLKTIIVSDKFVTNKIGDSQPLFGNSPSLVGGNGTTYNEDYINKEYARIDTANTPGYFTGVTVNTYTATINYNDGINETTTREVLEGGKIGYLPVLTKNHYKFLGWYTDLTAGEKIDGTYIITGDITVYGRWLYIEAADFTKSSWQDIIDAYKVGATEKLETQMRNGTIREIKLGKYGKQKIRIANLSTNENCGNYDYSETTCGFVIEFADIIDLYKISFFGSDRLLGGNNGGYIWSMMSSYLNDIEKEFPKSLRDVMIHTNVISSHGNSGTLNNKGKYMVYLLSTREVFDYTGELDTATEYTRQLDYYRENNVTTSSYAKAIKKNANTNTNWWLRTADSTNDDNYLYIKDTGELLTSPATNKFGVSPAFRIAE